MADDYLALYAAARPDDVAVIDGDWVQTLAEFNAAVNRYGHVLRDCGVRAGEKVLWVGQNSAEVVAINHAARKVGAVCVPMNYRLAPDEAQYVIDNCDAVVILFDIEQAEQLEPDPRRSASGCGSGSCSGSRAQRRPAWARDLDAEAAAASTDEPDREGDDPTAGTTMIYTSGTTGHPKGTVRRTTTNAADAAAFIQMVGWVPSDVYLSTGPLYHSAPLGFMLAVQAIGGSVVVQRHFDAEDWLRLVETHKVTTSFSAPTPVRRVVDLPEEVRAKYDSSSMQRLIANAAPWPFELKKKYVERVNDWSLFEVYGSTELGVNTMLLPGDQMRKPGSCGKPIPGVTIELVDDEGNVVTTPMEPGEVFIQSDATFATYYKDPDKYEAVQARRLPVGRRHRLLGRRGLPLHLRPQERHDHQRRREHLPGRDRGGARGPPGHRRRRRVRDPRRGVGRGRPRGRVHLRRRSPSTSRRCRRSAVSTWPASRCRGRSS